MRKAILYLLLFSYTTIVFKPVFPTIADTVAHIFWYSEHMATVHYEHGKYHVHYQYQQAAKNGCPEKDSTISKSESYSEHLIIAKSYTHPLYTLIKTKFLTASSGLAQMHLNNDFPPPKT
jgi:hypothetical protein